MGKLFGFSTNSGGNIPNKRRRMGKVAVPSVVDLQASPTILRNSPSYTDKYLIVNESEFVYGISAAAATPLFWTCDFDDGKLLDLINSLPKSPQNFPNLEKGVAWCADNNYMIINPGGEKNIPGANLVLYLDPQKIACWPRSGDVLYDLSGNDNHAVLANSPVIDNGIITWNGSNEYARVKYDSNMAGWANNQTVAMWVKHNISSGRRNPWNQAYGGYGTWTHENGGTISQYFGDAGRNASPYLGQSSATIPKNKWCLVASTRNTSQHKWYLDGNLSTVRSHGYGTLTTDANDVLIAYGYAGYWQGNMGPVMAYDRVLDEDEIKSIWYGGNIETNGLEFAIDPGVLGSYEPRAGAMVDLVSGGNCDLINGVKYVGVSGGVLNLDGVNAYITLPSTLTSLNGQPEASFGMWVKLESSSNGVSNTGIVQLSGYNSSNGNLYYYSNGYTYLDIFRTSRTAPYVGVATGLDATKWHYITVTTTPGTNGWKYYQDGRLLYQTSGQSTVSINGSIQGGLTLGRNSNSRYLRGQIGPTHIYNRALTADEVLQNFNAQRERFGI